MRSFCDLQEDPLFQALVDGLRDRLGEQAEFEAARDYLETDGFIRTPQEVLAKLREQVFSAYSEEAEELAQEPQKIADRYMQPIPEQPKSVDNKAAFKKAIKLSGKTVSGLQRAMINSRVAAANGKLGTSYYVKYTQVGESDNYTWEILDYGSKAQVAYFREDTPLSTQLAFEVSEYDNTEMSSRDTDSAQATETVTKIMTSLGAQLNIPYQVVTPEEAAKITADTKNPWSGEKAFYVGDTVHFVGNDLSTKTVFHEFSHPFVRAVALQNRALFDRIYEDLSKSGEGEEIIKQTRELYSDLNENDSLFKEEVIVRALAPKWQKGADNRFKNAINNLLYGIKQMLRKMFGQKINISALSPVTTLEQLGTMLVKGGQFSVETDVVTNEDVTAYMRDRKALIADLSKVSKPELEKLTNDFFDKVALQLSRVKKDENYEQMLDILANDFKAGELQQMRENLKPYQTKILERFTEYADNAQRDRQNVNAVLNTLFHLENLTDKIRQRLYEITNDVDNQDNLQHAFYCKQLLDHWDAFIRGADTQLVRSGLRSDSALSDLLGNIKNSISRGYDAINEIYEKGSKDVLTKELAFAAENIERKYTEMLADLRKRNAPQKFIDRLEREYRDARITPEKIEQALKGQLKDISSVGAFMEGYGYNPDPVVGGLALYVKNNMTEMITKIQQQYNDFANQMKPLLDAVGYNPNRPAELGQKIGFEDIVGYTDDNGEFQQRKVWRYLNEFKGHDYVQDEYRYKIRKASEKYAQTRTEEDKKALYDIQQEWKKHFSQYWHQEYVPRFYERFNLLEQDDIGREAAELRDNIFEQVQQLRDAPTSAEEDLKIGDQIEFLFRELRRASDIRDASGRLKTGRDLEIAKRLQEFNEVAKEFYDWKEVPGAFNGALINYEQSLIAEGKGRGSKEFETLRQAWLDKNTRQVAKQEFWDELTAISTRINEIMDLIPAELRGGIDIKTYLDQLNETLKGYKDEDGQPLGAEMTNDRIARVKKIQKEMQAAQDKLNTLMGLSPAEEFEMTQLLEKLVEGELQGKALARYTELLSRESQMPLNKFQKAELAGLFEQLNALRRKEPTDSYVDVVNGWLSTLDTSITYKRYVTNAIDKNNAWMILKDDVLEDLFAQSEEFKAWFRANHIRRTSFDQDSGGVRERWERIYAWNVMRPNNDKHYEKTAIYDESGKKVGEVRGLPSLKYYKRVVKPEFLTKKVVGRTVDNRGNWLPKTVSDGAPDNRYINADYEKLRRNDPKLFRVLEAFKDNHLRYQDGANVRSRLWMDMPRFRKHAVERVQAPGAFQSFVDRIKDFWTNIKDGFDSGFNFKDDNNLVKMDLWDDQTTGVPISGLSNLESTEVSLDIALTQMRYMASLERQKKLIEISPVARAIQHVVNNEQNFPFVEKALQNRTVLFSSKRKNKYVRAQAVNNFIEREFEGIQNVGIFSDNPVAQNLSNTIFKKAAFAYLGLNIPSAVYNAVSAKFQTMIESVAGRYYTLASWAAAEGWATRTTGQLILELYDRTSKSLDVQISEIFDVERHYEYKVGESLSRTAVKDTLDPIKRLTDFRRFTQTQASLQVLGAMLKHQKVKQGDKYIDYLSAWELRDGKIQLKEGVDPEWGITYDKDGNQIVGEKFKAKRNEIQSVLEHLNGAMAQESAPEAQRYLLARYLMFFRRFIIQMALNRFAYSGDLRNGSARGRYNFMEGNTREGWYITTLKLISRVVRSGGKYIPYSTTEERSAIMRSVTEVGSLLLISALIPMLWGYDEEDKDRFAKLRKKSGALPYPFVVDDPSRPFELGGWLSNHLLLTAMHIRGENEGFLPFPGFGLDEYKKYTDIKSIAFSATTNAWYNAFQDLINMATGDDAAYYKRDASPYEWGEKGDAKIFQHLAATLGLTGSTIDPAEAVKRYETARRRNF